MKKRLLSVFLCSTLVLSLMTGCGKDSVEESVGFDLEPQTETSVVVDEAEGAVESEAEKAGDVEASVEESVSTEVSADEDWSTKYDNFFDTAKMVQENFYMLVTTKEEGAEAKLGMGRVGNDTIMAIYPHVENGYGEEPFKIIGIGKTTYIYVPAAFTEEGTESMWLKHTSGGAEDEESIFDGMDDEVDFGEDNTLEGVTKVVYVGERTYNGVLCDELLVTVKDYDEFLEEETESDYTIYVDRAKQQPVLMENEKSVVEMSELESFDIPQEALDAAESDAETYASYLMVAIFSMIDMSAYGSDEDWNWDDEDWDFDDEDWNLNDEDWDFDEV